ncbi:MAG: hypothetical protein L0Z50_37740 [Verrucomicrobiales bacterium]|nr:hypothetical protein [Verrucomicrobiales bacterium]
MSVFIRTLLRTAAIFVAFTLTSVWAQTPPALEAAALADGTVIIQWLGNVAGFVLESVIELSDATQWQPWPDPPIRQADQLRVVVQTDLSSRFFRLRFVPPTEPPPDPVTLAPPLSTTAATTIATSTSFLYEGPNAIQIGVVPGTIEPLRVAVLRGGVKQRDGQPLPGVTVTVPKHLEFGATATRINGEFDLAVNGGERHCVRFEKAGFCPVDRELSTGYQTFEQVPQVVLMQMDPATTRVAFGLDSPQQVHEAAPQTDEDGTRTACLIFPPGTCAEMVMPDGTKRPCTALNIRATEFTVGTNGPAAMPAQLPPASAYTYCAELSSDEAAAAGADSIQFDRPVAFYVDNFLEVSVGAVVPVGYYDRQDGLWKALPNGRVIKILSITGGKADIDGNGDAQADDSAELAELSITDEERTRLAALHAPGKELWRALTTHFTPLDLNHAQRLPPDAKTNQNLKDLGYQPDVDPAYENGGYGSIERDTGVFAESLPLVGVPFTLNYTSERVPGFLPPRTFHLPVTSTNPPTGLLRVRVELQGAGQYHELDFGAAPSQAPPFVWNGQDPYVRRVQGTMRFQARFINDFGPAPYGKAPDDEFPSFGRLSGLPLIGSVSRLSTRLVIEGEAPPVTFLDARNLYGLGGWSLSAQHFYDPVARTLHYGNGRRRRADNVADKIETAATSAQLGPAGRPYRVAFHPDGSYFVLDFSGGTLVRVRPDGSTTLAAQSGSQFNPGPAGLADGAPLGVAVFIGEDIEVGPDGRVYLADSQLHRVIRIDPDNRVRIVAGGNGPGFSGDGGLAKLAQLNSPQRIAFGPDGSLFIVDTFNHRIRRVGPEGTVTTYAGNGNPSTPANPTPDEAPATEAPFLFFSIDCGLAAGPDGSVYFAAYGRGLFLDARINRVTPDGILRRFAGRGSVTDSTGLFAEGLGADRTMLTPDGGLARNIAVGRDGAVTFTTGANRVGMVRRVSPDGILTTVAGRTTFGFAGDGGPAPQALLSQAEDLALSPDGNVLIVDRGFNNRIRRVGGALPGFTAGEIFIASDNGAELYHFSADGRHLRTLDALTGAVLLDFRHDAAGRLLTVGDADGNETRIERNEAGTPLAIVGPYGHRSPLLLDAEGWLQRLINPIGEFTQVQHLTNGLLASVTGPRGNSFHFRYAPDGRLEEAIDPLDGTNTLAHVQDAAVHVITHVTALGRKNVIRNEPLPASARLRTELFSDGLTHLLANADNGTHTNLHSTGDLMTATDGADPRFGMQAPIAASFAYELPSGLKLLSTTTASATLLDAANPLSHSALSYATTVNGRTSRSDYTAAMRTITNTSPEGRVDVVTLDTQGRVVFAQAPGFAPVAVSYDARGRLREIIEGGGVAARTSRFSYDAAGFFVATVDALDRTNSFTYDGAGRLQTETSPGGRTIRHEFDAEGNRLALTPPSRPAHRFRYNGLNQFDRYESPVVDGVVPALDVQFNREGELTGLLRPDGSQVEFQLDAAGRLTNTVWRAGGGAILHATATANDARTGLPTNSVTSTGIEFRQTFDGLLPVRGAWLGTVTGVVANVFNNDFLLASQTVNGSNTIAWSYDRDLLVTNVGTFAIQRDPATGFVTGTQLGKLTEEFAYDEFGEGTNYVARVDGTPVFALAFEFDPLARVRRLTETADGTTTTSNYRHDSDGRLEGVEKNGGLTASYTYDDNGNRLTGPVAGPAWSYDDQDRLRAAGAVVFAHTANGERLTRTEGGQTTTYRYDPFGNLTRVELPDGRALDYLIDPRNRRVGKRVNGTLVRGWLYEAGFRVVAEIDDQNRVVSRFVYTQPSGTPAYFTRDGATFRILTDHLGSARLIVNSDTGDVAQRLDYDEFGRVLLDTNPGFQPFGFAGGHYDPDTQLVRFGARDYDPATGRFTTKDPVGFTGGGPNLYAYVGNDPINFVDPIGTGPFAGRIKSTDIFQDAALSGNDADLARATQQDQNITQAGLATGQVLVGAGMVVTAVIPGPKGPVATTYVPRPPPGLGRSPVITPKYPISPTSVPNTPKFNYTTTPKPNSPQGINYVTPTVPRNSGSGLSPGSFPGGKVNAGSGSAPTAPASSGAGTSGATSGGGDTLLTWL